MRNTKQQLEWEIKVLRLALRNCDSAYLDRGSQHWIEDAAMELTRQSVADGYIQGLRNRAAGLKTGLDDGPENSIIRP